jgi:transcriptional repressor NrdR
MRCPECGAQGTGVLDSRDSADTIRRRRVCLSCNTRFTTHERVERTQLFVTKRNGRKEPFSKDKIREGIAHACRKRPFTPEKIDALVDRVIRRLEARREAAVPAAIVGATVMQVLLEEDEVAYIRFASVYQSFESVDQFIEAIRPLQEQV